jgi:hypothetical protein
LLLKAMTKILKAMTKMGDLPNPAEHEAAEYEANRHRD